MPKNSPIRNLEPFVDNDGYLRVGDWIDNSDLPFENKHPLIVPSGHLSKLILKSIHLQIKHAGYLTIVASSRNTYWIVKAKSIAKSLIKSCIICLKMDSRPIQQPSNSLPESRVTKSPPFTVTGLDFAGPLYASD